jgi:hypothetical protein
MPAESLNPSQPVGGENTVIRATHGKAADEKKLRTLELFELRVELADFFLQSSHVGGVIHLFLGPRKLLLRLGQARSQDLDSFLGFLVHKDSLNQ